jgi:hypothetical protein
MGAFPDPVAFPMPAWLAGHSEPNIDDIVQQLGDETQQLYRQYLADEVRAERRPGVHPALRAFDRATVEMLRRNKERRAQGLGARQAREDRR